MIAGPAALAAFYLLDSLRDLAGPGIVFLVICIWLVRKVIKAARTESVMEENRLADALRAQPPEAESERPARPRLAAVPLPFLPPPDTAGDRSARASLATADTTTAAREHLDALAALLEDRDRTAAASGLPFAQVQVLWVRSSAQHVAWCERRHPATPSASLVRDVLGVAQVQDGKVIGRWTYG